MPDSLWPHELYSPWNSLGQDTGIGSLSLLQGIFPTQGSKPGVLHCRQILYHLSHKRGEWKSWIKTQQSKTKIMASSPITLWQIDGETMKTVTDFIFFDSKITADGGCSHEIKRCLHLGWKVMTNLDSILKSRDITLPTKVHLVKATVFPIVMYECESWIIRKAEHRRIDAFEL